MANSKIEAELISASNLSIKKKEDRQDFLGRLMLAVAKVPDQVWADLSQDARDWNDSATEAYNSGVDIQEFPDLEEELDDFPSTEEEVSPAKNGSVVVHAEETQEVPATGKKLGRPPGPKVDHKATIEEFGPPRRSSSKKVSACHIVKKMVVRRPTISVNEILDKLKENNLKVTPVTVATLRSSIRDTLRVLNEEGVGKFQL